MSIEFKCPGCGNALRVQQEHAGRQAKCPVCNQLTTVPSVPAPEPEPVDGSEQPEFTLPTSQTAAPAGATPAGMRPHRGVTILVFGICSVFCCGLLGIAAWLMANEDLSLMDRHLMDPAGRGMTMAGKILGILALVLFVFGNILAIVMNS